MHGFIPCSGSAGRYDTPLNSQREELFTVVVDVVHVFGSNSSSARSLIATTAYRANSWFLPALNKIALFYIGFLTSKHDLPCIRTLCVYDCIMS